MINIFKPILKILGFTHKVVHNVREDFEDFIAEQILDRLDGSEKVDELERKMVSAIINYLSIQEASSSMAVTGVSFAREHEKEIQDAVVNCMDKANRIISKQLKKGHKI